MRSRGRADPQATGQRGWRRALRHPLAAKPREPEDMQASSQMGCHLSPKSLVLLQLPARLRLSEKSELIGLTSSGLLFWGGTVENHYTLLRLLNWKSNQRLDLFVAAAQELCFGF